jgi:hypothetical protein
MRPKYASRSWNVAIASVICVTPTSVENTNGHMPETGACGAPPTPVATLTRRAPAGRATAPAPHAHGGTLAPVNVASPDICEYTDVVSGTPVYRVTTRAPTPRSASSVSERVAAAAPTVEPSREGASVTCRITGIAASRRPTPPPSPSATPSTRFVSGLNGGTTAPQADTPSPVAIWYSALKT